MFKKSLYITLLILGLPLLTASQSINTTFGKNRVQYHNNFKYWWVYETQNFKTYWYDLGKNVAITALQLAELDFDEIQNMLEHRLNDKIEIVVYTDLSDLKMSNIGAEETFITISGRTKVAKNKIFVYFDGNHNNLRKQIRQGVAEVFVNSMLFGNSFQELVQNAVMFNVPDWYQQGIAKYVETPWDEYSDDELRRLLTRDKRKYKNFRRLSKDHPQLAGHSFWKFLGDTYGKSTISNILYLTRINRNMEAAFIYVIGVPFRQLRLDWYIYYMQQYRDLNSELIRTPDSLFFKTKIKRQTHVSDLKISPSGEYMAFVDNRIGKARVKLCNLESNNCYTILKVGKRNPFENTDYNYPILSWAPAGNELSIIYEVRDLLKHKRILIDSDEEINDLFAPEYRRVYSADYLNGQELILSATTDGFSDLYRYNMRNRQSTRLNNDFYDDIDVRIAEINGKKGVLFASNRPDKYLIDRKLDTILPISHFDIFFMEIQEDKNILHRISNTPGESERKPIALSGNRISYLSSSSGIINRRISQITSLEELPTAYYNSNVHSNILHHDYNGGQYLKVQEKGIKEAIVKANIDFDQSLSPVVTDFKRLEKGLKKPVRNALEDKSIHIESTSYIDPKYYFQTEFKEKRIVEPNPLDFSIFNQPILPLQKKKDEDKTVVKFINSRATASRVRFRIDDVTSRMDNSVLFEGLDSYAGDRQEAYQHTPFGYLVKANLTDIFEDYSFEGGARIPAELNGSELFLTFDDKKKRIDKRYALYRKTFSERPDFFLNPGLSSRKNTLIGMYQLKYPFDYFTSLRASFTYRNDVFFDLVSNRENLETPNITGQRLGLKLEYIYDNTFDVDLNIKNGLRYKFYLEGVNRLNVNLSPPYSFRLSEAFMTVAGFDARHYLPIGRYGVWANRIAGATNFGSERTLYYLGGVESWIIPSFETSTPTPAGNYAFSTVAANVRGFRYNARNGTSFALFNSELRLPIFSMISPGKIRYKFIRNFQLTAFFDAGAAWHGLTPYSDENIINTLTLESPPAVVVNVRYFRDPLIYGYGLGLRTSFFGYFMKFDYGWGVETRIVQKPRLYFSLGMDF